MTVAPVLLAEGVERVFEAVPRRIRIVLDHLTLGAGEIALMQAPSGSGKSTVLGMLGLAIRPDRVARLELAGGAGERVDGAASWRRAARKELAAARASLIGFVMQSGALIPFLTLRENILEPLRLQTRAIHDEVGALAAELGLEDVLDRRPGAVSLGQRQRAALARALIGRPPLLLADEPTAALDLDTAEAVERLIVEAVERRGAAALIATHRPNSVLAGHARRVIQRSERLDGEFRSVFSRDLA